MNQKLKNTLTFLCASRVASQNGFTLNQLVIDLKDHCVQHGLKMPTIEDIFNEISWMDYSPKDKWWTANVD